MTKTEFRAYVSLMVLKTLRMGFSSKIRAPKCRHLPVHIYVWAKCPAPILFSRGLGLDRAAIPLSDSWNFWVSEDTMKSTDSTPDFWDCKSVWGESRDTWVTTGYFKCLCFLCGDKWVKPLVSAVNLEIYLVYPKITPHTLAAAGVQLPACAGQISTGYMSFET